MYNYGLCTRNEFICFVTMILDMHFYDIYGFIYCHLDCMCFLNKLVFMVLHGINAVL